jgi:hypothetical protein
VRSRTSYGTAIFILGTDTNIEIARYVHSHLKATFKTLFKAYKLKTGCPATSRQSYYLGLYKGLSAQLTETKKNVEQETGLVLVKDSALSDFKDGQFSRLTKSRARFTDRDGSARAAGHTDGGNIRISKGIESRGPRGMLLA